MGGPIVKTYTNHEGDFFQIMGKYFAFRDYAHEMGGWQFYTKKGSVWFVLMDGENVLGFCSIIQERNHIFFDNFYMLKEHRGKGLSRLLWEERMKYAKSMKQEIRVISDNPIQIQRYEKEGFAFYGMRGKYFKYKMTWHN
jgi:GNAT superfamily N-acetyltransferase